MEVRSVSLPGERKTSAKHSEGRAGFFITLQLCGLGAQLRTSSRVISIVFAPALTLKTPPRYGSKVSCLKWKMALCCASNGIGKSFVGSGCWLLCAKAEGTRSRAIPAIRTVIAPDFRKLRRVAFILLDAPKLRGGRGDGSLLPRLQGRGSVYNGRAADNHFYEFFQISVLPNVRRSFKIPTLRFTHRRKSSRE